VPVLTLCGSSTLERSGLSLLTAGGLSNWVTYSKDDYVAMAVAMATKPDSLAELRFGMRDRLTRSSLCDGRRFMVGMEQALLEMWRAWCRRKREGRP